MPRVITAASTTPVSWRSIQWLFLALVAAALLGGCAAQEERQAREDTLRSFEAQMRFGNNFAALINFIHPEYLKDNPISSAEVRRLELFQVGGYRARSVVVADDDKSVSQVVELRLYNKRTARERIIMYPQIWKLDEDSKRWMMHSGLPEIRDN